MKKIVIIGANEFQNPLILKAKEMGYETHVFAWKEGAVGEKTADYFYPISIIEKQDILEKCKEIKPCAVATIASDLANVTVQYLAKNLNLPCNSDECIINSTNKYQMRQALKKAGVSTPFFYSVTDINQLPLGAITYPVIVKPTDRSGSRGITKVVCERQLEQAVKCAVEHSFEKKAIVEEYIEGQEYSCESISFEGKHTLLAVTKKFTTGAPHFIETGHIEPSNLDKEMLLKVQETVFAGLTALKIQNGASHAEFRISPLGEVKIIEIGSRMGGDCIGSHLVQMSTGYDFVKMVIDTASGKSPDFSLVNQGMPVAIRFIFEKKDLDVLEKIKIEDADSIKFISPIDRIGERKVVDSGTRYGFYIVANKNYERLIELTELS